MLTRFVFTAILFLLGCLTPDGAAQSDSPTAKPPTVTPESAFTSASKYTNAFFGFALPMPKNLASLFREATPPLNGVSSHHFLFGLQSLSTNYSGAHATPIKPTLLNVTAEQSSAAPDEARKAASGPKGQSVTQIEIGGKEFWKGELQEKVPQGKMRSIVFATALNGFVLQFDVESFDGKLTDELQNCIAAIVFFDPAKARDVAGPDSRAYNPAISAVGLSSN